MANSLYYNLRLLTTNNVVNQFIRCSSRPAKSGGNVLIALAILTLVLLITSFCYANIIYEVNKIDGRLLNNDTIKKREQMRAHVSKKIAGYILIFILQ